jgi:hypothetical protein
MSFAFNLAGLNFVDHSALEKQETGTNFATPDMKNEKVLSATIYAARVAQECTTQLWLPQRNPS